MSTNNLADAFGRGSRPDKPPAGDKPAANRGTATRRLTATGDETLAAAGVWLPVSLHARLNVYCQKARIPQAEVILRAVDYAADHLDELVSKPRPAPKVEQTGGLFPRPIAAVERDPGRAVSIRFRSDHLTTLTRLAGDHGLKRSALIKLSLLDYFDHLEQAEAQ